VVDDLISSGQTLVGLIQAIQKLGGIVSDAICIGEEIDQNGRAFVKKTTGITVKTFVKYRTKDLKYTQVI
jgi:adenine/guanine phosphoribosyltransferase-like PRPP-binding protein